MALVVYPALVGDADPAELHAVFPNFAGLVVKAASPAELLTLARERLSEVLRTLEKAGDGWPAPSTLAEVRAAHPQHAGSVVWVDVAVEDTPIRVTISIGERLLARIDSAAEAHAMTRSGYLAAAARRQMASGGSPLETPAAQRLFDEVAATGRRIQDTLGPESPVGRTLAELDQIALDGLRRMAGGLSSAVRPPARSQGAPAADAEPPASPPSDPVD